MTKIKKIIVCFLAAMLCISSFTPLPAKADIGSTNLALAASVEVSAGTNGARINDGSKAEASHWDSGANENAYAILDLKETKNLGSVKIFNYTGKVYQQSYERWYQYEIYASTNKEDWEKIGEKKNQNISTTAGDEYILPEGGVEARYLKLVSFGGNSADSRIFHLMEIEAYEYVEEAFENVALFKPVTGPGVAANITDGNINNYCDLGATPGTFTIDLEDYYEVNEIMAFPYFTGGRIYKYNIEASVDGLTYTKIGEKQDDTTATISGKSFKFEDELIVRYIRVTMTYNSANASVHMNEMQVFGKKAEGYVPPQPPTIDPNDEDNIAFRKPTRANMNKVASNAVVDSSNDTAWSSLSFPANVDVDLEKNYNLDEIILHFPQVANRYYQYSVYTSVDGVNFDRVAQKRNHDPVDADGDLLDLEGKEARIIRVNVEACSDGNDAHLSEIKVHGIESGTAVTPRTELSISDFEDSDYAAPITEADTVGEIHNLVERLLGSGYEDYFSFDIVESMDGTDYYEISDKNGKIHIIGNEGVSITAGLNYYLKYFCNVHISQQNEQIDTMPAPDAVIPVGSTIHKDTPLDVRYAYNYCTNQYTNAFFGIDEWQRELDWMALNGVNLVLDISGLEAVWVDFLQKMGYSTDDAKAWLTGPAYYAWQFMSNMESYGGPISDQYVMDKLELARRNQHQMRLLGMTPVLQGYAGMLPSDYASIVKDKPEFKKYADALIPQSTWAGYNRPYMFDPRSELFEDCAEKFYESQRKVLGDTSNYYAADLYHEGGVRPPDLSDAVLSAEVLDTMMSFDEEAVWVIQSWENNPTQGALSGLGDNKADHALVLDLSSTTDPHYNNSKWGDEFYSTPWVYGILDNYGQRPDMHGELNVIAKMPSVINDIGLEYITGIGITPEGMRMNPVTYDLFFETAWEDEAINTEEWLKDYITRRYGEYSEDAYKGWMGLLSTTYGAAQDNHRGGFNARVNYGPEYTAGMLGQTKSIPYSPAKFERAVEDVLKDYDKLKDNEAYQYDVAFLLRQILQNSQLSYYNTMMAATPDSAEFNENAQLLLDSILLVDEVSGTQEDELLGNWIGAAEDLAEDYDDFSKDAFEIQAKTLITAWGGKKAASSLQDYAYRQYAGLEKDYVYPRWEKYINAKREGKAFPQDVYFNDTYDFILNNVDYTREATDAAVELKTLAEEIMADFTPYDVEIPVVDDNVAIRGDGTSGNGSNSPVSNINDKNAGTLWIAGSKNVPSTVTLELDDVYDVYKMQIRFEDGANSPYSRGDYATYNIEAFNDETQEWEEVYAGTTEDGTIGTQKFPNLITTDKVRVNITAISGTQWPAFAELEVYASAGIKLAEDSALTLADDEVSGIDTGKTVADVKAGLTADVGELKIFRGDTELSATDEVKAGDVVKLFVETDIEVDAVTIDMEAAAVNKQALQDLTDSVKDYKAETYTPSSYAAFQPILAAAQAVLADPEATQAQVDSAVSTLQQAKDQLMNRADMSALNALIDEGKTKVEEAYTSESWSGFAEALANAEAVSSNGNATQAEADAAASELSDAMEALVRVQPEGINTEELEKSIAELEQLDEKAYTADSWEQLQTALTAAKEVLANPNAAQAEIDAQITALQQAKEALVKNQSDGGKEDDNKGDDSKGDDSKGNNAKGNDGKKSPATGDSQNVEWYYGILIMSLAALIGYVIKKRKKATK